MKRAIVFDLDDTLYPERRFALSGFAAVAREVERRSGVPRCDAFAVLRRALTTGRRDTALQILCTRFDLPMRMVAEFRTIVRTHVPRLKLPTESSEALGALGREWRVGILTNGLPKTQANKVAALGLSSRVDAIVYASAHGPGKPHPASFERILDQLGARAAQTVFVGDDPWCDIFGARAAGMKTIRVRGDLRVPVALVGLTDADAVVDSLLAVPAVASGLLGDVERSRSQRHVA